MGSKNTRCILKELLEKKGDQPIDIYSNTDIPKNTAVRAFKEGFLPVYSTLEKFAQYLDMRPIDLYQITAIPRQFK